MKFNCLKEHFVEAISTVQKAVSTRSTMPILDGILIEVSDSVKLTGYDLEIGIEYKFEADVSQQGSIVIKSRVLGDIIRKLPEDIVYFEAGTGGGVVIESGSSKFTIKGLDADGYPKIPEVEEYEKISLPQADFKSMIQQSIFAVSNDESRPVLNGSNIKITENNLEMVAIDGFRLALRRLQLEKETPDISFIVPGKSLSELARIGALGEENIAIYKSSNHIMFEMDNVKLVSRIIAGEYMNYESIIPKTAETTVTLNSSQLLSAVERAHLIITSDERKFPISLKTDESDRLIVSANTDIGSVREEMSIVQSGNLIDIDFNPRYFIDALKSIRDEEVEISFNGNMGPCVIRPIEGNTFEYLVLPLRR